MRWFVLLLTSTVAFAETPDPARQCKSVGQATTDAGVAKLRNEARFRDALAKRGLRSIVPVREATTVTQKVVASTVVSLRRNSRDVRFVVGPVDGEWEFGVNVAGDVFAIERKPIHRFGSPTPVACGCEPTTSKVAGASRYLYMLPDNVVFRGVVAIDYASDPDGVLFSNRQRDGAWCPVPVGDPFTFAGGLRRYVLDPHPPAYVDWPFD